jgi:hypothetical protein
MFRVVPTEDEIRQSASSLGLLPVPDDRKGRHTWAVENCNNIVVLYEKSRRNAWLISKALDVRSSLLNRAFFTAGRPEFCPPSYLKTVDPNFQGEVRQRSKEGKPQRLELGKFCSAEDFAIAILEGYAKLKIEVEALTKIGERLSKENSYYKSRLEDKVVDRSKEFSDKLKNVLVTSSEDRLSG